MMNCMKMNLLPALNRRNRCIFWQRPPFRRNNNKVHLQNQHAARRRRKPDTIHHPVHQSRYKLDNLNNPYNPLYKLKVKSKK
jgi:hypothetical protein